MMVAPNVAGAVSSILGSIWVASAPAYAYHDNTGHTGAPIGAILPIVIAVAIGVIALAYWKPQSRRGKLKKRERAPGYRAAQKGHKRSR